MHSTHGSGKREAARFIFSDDAPIENPSQQAPPFL
jgi:hypothetical protein